METITLQTHRDPKELIKQPALIEHGEILIDKPFIGVDEDGVTQLVYLKMPDNKDTETYRKIVKKLKYNKSTRVSGLKTQSTIFGFSPPVEMRQKPFCSSTLLMEQFPKANQYLAWYCEKYFMPMFEEYYKENLDEHVRILIKEKISDDWIMNGTVFTGGVINKSNQLNYHIDHQNIRGTINAMPYFTRDMEGGELVVPKYNARIMPLDGHVLLFRNDLVHGVAPLKHLNKSSYRYSVVYYVQNRMQHCGTLLEELAKARK